MAQNSAMHTSSALAFVLHYLNSMLPEKTASLVDEMKVNPANLLNWYKYIGSRLNCSKSHMDMHNDFVLSFTERKGRIWGDADTDDKCVSPDTIPIDDVIHYTPFQSAAAAAATATATATVAPTNSNIICVADDDDNSVMTAATSNANLDFTTATAAADNLGFDHPDVVEQLMKFDFEFADSRSQSISPAQHQGQSHAEAEPQTQYLGHYEAQSQQQQHQHHNQCHSPSFEFQVLSHQINCLRYCKKIRMISSRIN